MAVIKNDFLSKSDKEYLMGKGGGRVESHYIEHMEREGYNVLQLSEFHYITVPVAKDWLEFREIKTGDLAKDFEWWLYEARGRYGLYPCDLKAIKKKKYTYEDIERYGESVVSFMHGAEKKEFNLDLDTHVRMHLLKMNNFFDKYQ